MDGTRQRLLLLLGILCLIGGMIGAGLTYRSMRTENLVHARTGELSVPFADTALSVSARFQPYAAGVHRLYLTAGLTPGPVSGPSDGRVSAQGPGCPDETFRRDLTLLDGIIDIAVIDAGGRVVLSRSVGPGDAGDLHREPNGWVFIDSVTVPPTRDSAWSLEVSYCPGTSFAPACPWVVFLLPPQEVEIGAFLGDRMRLLLIFGGVMLAGFILIVAAGRKRR